MYTRVCRERHTAGWYEQERLRLIIRVYYERDELEQMGWTGHVAGTSR